MEKLALPLLVALMGCPGSEPLEITTASLPKAMVGDDYSAQLAATGGDGAYSFAAIDALPEGLALSANGTIAGVPATDGDFSFVVEVTDGSDRTARRMLSISIDPRPLAELTILTGDLLVARVTEAYQRQITAAGGNGEYTWSVSEGALPPGLELAAGGTPSTELAGTATAEGSYAFTVRVADASGMSATKAYTLVVQPKATQTFEIRSFLLPDGVVGLSYSAPLQVTNATGGVTWTVDSGDLPPGLALAEAGDPNTTVDGLPELAGDFVFVVRATDVDGDTDTQRLTVHISAEFVPILIETAAVPTATIGVPYNASILARYGTGSGFTWSVTSGQLPDGLMLASSGTPAVLIDGTPTTRGTFTATITVHDSNGDVAARAFDFEVVDPPLVIATTLLPPGDLGVAYSESIIAAGGSGSGHSWRVSTGTVPPGLTLQPSSQDHVTLDGTPTMVGVSDFTLEVSDSGGQVATRDFRIPIYARVEVTTSTLPDGDVGAAYAVSLSAQGGDGSYTYQISGGALPPGLSLSAAGVIGGVPTAPGNAGFIVTALDSRGSSGARSLSIAVFQDTAQLALTTPSLPGAGSGVAYAAEVTAAGGSESGYTFTVDSGALPPGLSLTSGTPSASISGTSVALGSYGFTLRVTDSAGGTATRPYTIDVLPPLTITTMTLPARPECASVRQGIAASGGSGAGYLWSAPAGLPPGLQLDPAQTPATTLSGRATAPGSYPTLIRVTDSAGLTAERTLSISVTANPDAQRYALLVGDLLVDDDTEVYLTNVCGDQASALTALEPPAPGTGDASLDPSDAVFSPDQRRIAFIGDFMNDGVDELFLSTVSPTMTRRINGPITPGGDVHQVFWSPDSSMIVYLADQNSDGVDEIFVVDVSNPSMPSFPVQVNGPLGANSDVTDVFWAPDSGGLIYRADPTDNAFELFYVDLAFPTLPGTPVRLHNALAAPQACDPRVDWTPSGNGVIFRCDSTAAGVFQLWYVRFSLGVPQAAQRVNGNLVAGGDVLAGSFAFSPDGSGVAYIADQNTDDVFELYLAVTFGGSIMQGVRALSPLAANRDVTAFEFGSTALRGLLRGDLNTDEVFELYLIDSSSGFPVVPIRLNGAMVSGGDVDPTHFGFSPAGDRVAYLADQNRRRAPRALRGGHQRPGARGSGAHEPDPRRRRRHLGRHLRVLARDLAHRHARRLLRGQSSRAGLRRARHRRGPSAEPPASVRRRRPRLHLARRWRRDPVRCRHGAGRRGRGLVRRRLRTHAEHAREAPSAGPGGRRARLLLARALTALHQRLQRVARQPCLLGRARDVAAVPLEQHAHVPPLEVRDHALLGLVKAEPGVLRPGAAHPE